MHKFQWVVFAIGALLICEGAFPIQFNLSRFQPRKFKLRAVGAAVMGFGIVVIVLMLTYFLLG